MLNGPGALQFYKCSAIVVTEADDKWVFKTQMYQLIIKSLR